MRRSHRGSARVADRRPRGSRNIGRSRNRLSKKGRRSTSHREFSGEPTGRDQHEPRRRASHSGVSRQAASLPAPGVSPTLTTYIRATGTHFGSEERDYTQRKLDQKLGKFGQSIERISIRIDDVNGPRGGVDQKCRMKVVLTGQPSVIVETQRAEPHTAVDAAIQSAEKTVRRTIQRRRRR